MKQRDFAMPTEEEIARRRKMYAEAEKLGIDLLKFDNHEREAGLKSDIRKAIIFLGTGKEVPAELRERLIQRNKKQFEKKI